VSQPPSPKTPPSRRDFLGIAWKGLGFLAAAELVALLGAYLWPRLNKGRCAGGIVTAGVAADFTPASVTPFPEGRFYLVRLADGGFLALSAVCSHLGCAVPWNEKDQVFPCPCHASVFDITGAVKSPPAPRPLDLLPVAIEGGVVTVDTHKRIKRDRFEPSQVVYL
jgi:cytochrome b6-f complex iron-sulfur subunit